MCTYIYIYIYTHTYIHVCVYIYIHASIYIYIYIYIYILVCLKYCMCVYCCCLYDFCRRASLGSDVYIDYQRCCPKPWRKELEKSLPKFAPLGVVVRCRTVVTEHITLRPCRKQLLKCFCSWDTKSLEHTLSSYIG